MFFWRSDLRFTALLVLVLVQKIGSFHATFHEKRGQRTIVANIMEYYSLTQINSGPKNVVKFICQ